MSVLSGEYFDGNFYLLLRSVNAFFFFFLSVLAALQAALHNIAHGWDKFSLIPAS